MVDIVRTLLGLEEQKAEPKPKKKAKRKAKKKSDPKPDPRMERTSKFVRPTRRAEPEPEPKSFDPYPDEASEDD